MNINEEALDMGATKSRKRREKAIREGSYDPANSRGTWNGILPVERKTPTLRQVLAKQQNKHKQKWNHAHKSDDSIFVRIRKIYSIRLSLSSLTAACFRSSSSGEDVTSRISNRNIKIGIPMINPQTPRKCSEKINTMNV